MKRGETEVQTLLLNGWGVGDILEGDEGYGPERILITAMGEERFLCRWSYANDVKFERGFNEERGSTTLRLRVWKKVGRIEDRNADVVMDALAAAHEAFRNKENEAKKSGDKEQEQAYKDRADQMLDAVRVHLGFEK